MSRYSVSSLRDVPNISLERGGGPAAPSDTATLLRLHPHFVPPSTASSNGFTPPASGVTNSRGVTGGVYKTRERIHRSMLIYDY